jgi:hypothetical protein
MGRPGEAGNNASTPRGALIAIPGLPQHIGNLFLAQSNPFLLTINEANN